MYALILSLSIAVSLTGWSHGHHGHSEEDFLTVSRYLDAAFIEIDKEENSTTDIHKLVFRDTQGNRFSLPKSRLITALTKAYSAALEDHCSHSSCSHHCQDAEQKQKNFEQFQVWIKAALMGPVTGAQAIAMDLPKHLSYLASQIGILPASFVLAVWMPYSFVTEVLESTVMGPWHWACPFFQMVFWGPVFYSVWDYNLLKDVALFKGSQLGIWGRLAAVFKNRFKEFQFRRTLLKMVIEDIPEEWDRKKLKKSLPHKNPVAKAFIGSSLWFNLFPAANETGAQTAPSTDLDPTLVRSEQMASIHLLRNLIAKELDLAYEAKQMSYSSQVQGLYQLGMLDNTLGVFHRSLWISSQEGESELLNTWAEKSTEKLLVAMKTFHEFLNKGATKEFLKETLEEAKAQVFSYRQGELTSASCAASLVDESSDY